MTQSSRDAAFFSQLVDDVRCPRCGRRSFKLSPESMRALCVCYRSECHQDWWVMHLDPGAIEPQLTRDFGDAIARELVDIWALPASIAAPKFWQLRLSRRIVEQYRDRRAIEMIIALTRLVRARSA